MFYKLKEPPQWLLDGLLNEEKARDNKCPDCQVSPGIPHIDGCDVARCRATGVQRLQCDCGKCRSEIWTGMWPGVQECYEKKLVCFDTATSSVMFYLTGECLTRAK